MQEILRFVRGLTSWVNCDPPYSERGMGSGAETARSVTR